MSREYSQQELLLLSNYVYIPASVSDRPINEVINAYRDDSGSFSAKSVMGAAAGGGMCAEDVAIVFAKMDEHISSDPSFGHLSVSRTLEEKDVRALCFTDRKDESPVVVFRGTGGTENAWRDNFDGAYEEDTKIQKIADDFIKTECSMYEDIVVTGHSKGGNLAQYVTVRNGNIVGSCVSYDGQGFGGDFISSNRELVETAAPKITSISSYNDFVNILLTCIAGTSIYIANDDSIAGAHSPTTLLTHNTFDENGKITSTVSQGLVAKGLDALTEVIVKGLEPLSDGGKHSLGDIAGSAVSSALSSQKGEIVNDCIAPTIGLAAAQAIKTMMPCDEVSVRNPPVSSVHIDMMCCQMASDDLTAAIRKTERMIMRIERVRADIAHSVTTSLVAERALGGICDDLGDVIRKLQDISGTVEYALERYANAESEVIALLNA